MTFKVFVDGQEGTTGLRIHEYLAARSDIEVLKIAADKRKDAAERARLLNAADVAFLCLPDAASREAAELYLTGPDDRIRIEIESGIAGAITFAPIDFIDHIGTAVLVGGKQVAIFDEVVTEGDPRITITRDAVFA